MYPPSKIFAKLVNKNAIKHQKGIPSQKNFHNPLLPFPQKFGNTSWTLPLDSQTVCIYAFILSRFLVPQLQNLLSQALSKFRVTIFFISICIFYRFVILIINMSLCVYVLCYLVFSST